MNRTITMNLSGIIFHIEEDAYEKLNKYLSTIRSYFNDADSRDEIMNDIESRIAEMLQEKVSKNKQAVLMMDVDSVIGQMGRPEDFAGESGEKKEQAKSDEPFVAYSSRRRRVFRDTDEKLLGGVCSGIGNYFNFDPIWLRAAFAIAFFLFGTGLLLYIILWIIIPEAKTTAEKLEMRGEKVDINNIGKAVSEEFEGIKKRMEDFGARVNTGETRERARTSAQRAGDFAGDMIRNIFRIVAKTFTVFAIFFAVIIMVLLLSSAFGTTNVFHFDSNGQNYSMTLQEITRNFLPDNTSPTLAIIGMLLLVGIPMLSIIYSGVKYLLGIRQENRYIKYSTNALWLGGVVIMVIVIMQVMNDFSETATVKHTVELEQHDTMYLNLKGFNQYSEERDHKYYKRYHFAKWKFDYSTQDSDKAFFIGPVQVDIVQSETDSFELVEVRTACGGDRKDASLRARNITYQFSQRDSLIEFGGATGIDHMDKWRDQELKLILKVPVGKVIYLSRGMEHIIYDIDNVTNTLDSEMTGRRWIMRKEGLTCVDCDGLDDVRTTTNPHDLPHPPAPPAPPADH